MSSAWSLIGLTLAAGCTQRHLSIGEVDEVDAAVDSGQEPTFPDARADERPMVDASAGRDAQRMEAGGPLDVKLRVFEREDVSTLRTRCDAGCADFEVMVRGGIPPYQISWVDGVSESRRTFCPGADHELSIGLMLNPLVTVDVVDSSPDAGRARTETSIVFGGCDGAVAGPEGWEICLSPSAVQGVSCLDETQNGLWFALAEPVDGPAVRVSAVVSGATLLTMVPVELWLAAEPCGPVIPAGGATIHAANASVRGSANVRGARFVLLRSLSGAAEALPAWLSVTELSVCLDR